MINSPIKEEKRARSRSNSPEVKVLAENHFLFKGQGQESALSTVKLYEGYITIQQQDQPKNKSKIQMDSDTIFSILRKNKNEQQEKMHNGTPYGIKFEKFEDSIEIINQDQPQIFQNWRRLLGRFLNQRNFHQIFKPVKRLGKGNFATVYLLLKHQDKNLYAAKAFSKEIQYNDEKGKESLQNQIKIMRSLNHQNLMKLQGVYETDNSIYFVVQYLSGGVLYQKIRRRHQFTTDQILQIMRSLLNGLAYMHEKRIMHRDLKPQNIIFRQQNSYQCVIADFGLATFADIQQYIYTRCGTPGYVAPQITNLKNKKEHYQTICDIFSLGVIFHIIALGASPFPGKQCDEVFQQNRQCNIDFTSQIYKRIHPTWLDLMKRMLQKNPGNRISAKDALQHQFFTESSVAILEQLPVSKYQECDSPLMISKNRNRKVNLKLRDDSCLKFKMKENIQLSREDQENIQNINSPLRKKKNKTRIDRTSRTANPSNFKQ